MQNIISHNTVAAKQSCESVTTRSQRLRARLFSVKNQFFKTFIQFITISALIFWGWSSKQEEYLTAEDGIGYALGIVGGSMMIILLIYPLRKKLKSAPYMGSVPSWFKFHMFCGVFGPIAILYHSNYSMGSLNSSVAMWCMILVASSGLVGRYFYSKIHYGLYGKKASLKELYEIINDEAHQLSELYKIVPGISKRLESYHQQSLVKLDFLQSVKRFITLGFKVRLSLILLPFELSKTLKKRANEQSNPLPAKKINLMLKQHINNFLKAILKTCEFSIYERLFGLWHILHLPLFFMLVISGIVHVYAVHMY